MAYPDSIDSFPDRNDGDTIPATDHDDLAAAVVRTQTELGLNPAGTSADVAERLDTIESNLPHNHAGVYGVLTGPNTWTGVQDFSSATLVGISAASGVNEADTGYDVIVLAGQSNMAGPISSASFSPNFYDPMDPQIWRWVANACGDTGLFAYKRQITCASEPLGFPDPGTTHGGIGPGFSFAHWYANSVLPNRRVLLVPVALGGTPLVSGSHPTWNSTITGSLFTQAVTEANLAIAAAGTNARIKAILWLQGESDALSSVSGASYQAALDALIDAFRSQITGASSTTPFVIGEMVPEFTSGTAAAIRAVHAATPGRVAYTGYAAGVSGATGDNLHYLAAAQRTMGRRFFLAYVAAKTNVLTPGAPAQVTGLTATGALGQVGLSWTPPTSPGSAIWDYVVQFKLTAATTWATFSDGISTATSATVTGLTNGASYDFRVAAVNGTGQGQFSASATATPSAGATPSAPRNLSGVFVPAGVALTWAAPASDGGAAVTDYLVEYKTLVGGSWTTFADGVSTGTSATITGLTAGVAYSFRVSAINSVGTGTASDVVSVAVTSSTSLATYDARALGLNDGSAVSSWSDLSGASRTVSQATSTSQPAYQATGLNSKPTVSFDGGDWLAATAVANNTLFPTGLYTVFAVGAYSHTSGITCIAGVDENSGSGRQWQLRGNATGPVAEALVFNQSAAAAFTDTQTVTLGGVAHVFSMARDTSTVQIWVDGTSGGSTATTGSPNTVATNVRIVVGAGGAAGAVPGLPLVGKLSYLAIYQGVLSATDRQNIEAALKADFATP